MGQLCDSILCNKALALSGRGRGGLSSVSVTLALQNPQKNHLHLVGAALIQTVWEAENMKEEKYEGVNKHMKSSTWDL